MKYNAGLVLEGGGMRGVYTAGFLDCLIDYDIRFPYVIGTSAGSTNGLSYISRQKGRSRYCDTDLLKKHNYIGLLPMIAGHGIIDMDFLFDTFPTQYYPFDFETYRQSRVQFVAVASDVDTGKAVYMEEYENIERFVQMVRASCSLPMVCPMCTVDGRQMVDGGVTDSIPFRRAIADGCKKVVVIMTKETGYRKPCGDVKLPPMIYSSHPELRHAMRIRNDEYNKQLDELEQAEKDGLALVIRPTDNCGVGRTTDSIENLERLYNHGYYMALEHINTIKNFVQ